jgi:hypothetical protein
MIKVIRAFDMTDRSHAFSIVATDKGFKYIFPSAEDEIFDSGKRVQRLLDTAKKDRKSYTVDDYLGLAQFNLSNYYFSEAFEEPSEKIAIKSEKLKMEKNKEAAKTDEVYSKSAELTRRSLDIEQVFLDFPELYEQLISDDPDQEITASGMEEFMFAALGSVDPNGPYSGLLDYLDGESDTSTGADETGKK